MDTIFNGDVKGKNIVIGKDSVINEIYIKNIIKDGERSREEIIEQLDKIEKMVIENRDQFDNVRSLGQDISALREEFNQKHMNKNTIDTKLSKLETGVKSISNIALAVNTIRTLILSAI